MTVRFVQRATCAALLLSAPTLAPPALSQAQAPAAAAAVTKAECERAYQPRVGQSGKDVIWVPTPDEVVARMLEMAEVTPDDTVVDLGSGDGKIAIAAGKRGASARGIEFNPGMVRLAQCMVRAEGMTGKTTIVEGDIFKTDFSDADVITAYLLPRLNLCIRHRLLQMDPGTRIATHAFDMGDWEADEKDLVDGRTVYLWIVPARVGGAWAFEEKDGPLRLSVTFDQQFQKATGEVVSGGERRPLTDVALRGAAIRFAFRDDDGATRTFSGTVRGDAMFGRLRTEGGGEAHESEMTGTQQGEALAADWARMQPECASYYGQAASGRR